MFINYTGERKDLQLDTHNNLQNSVFEGYTMADATLQKGFLSNKLRVTIGAKNIFNVTQISSTMVNSGGVHSSGTSSPLSYGTTYFTRLQWTF